MPGAHEPDLWRIGNHKSLAGEGGLRYGARWHSAGRRIVYLAESPAGAMLEILVHLELGEDELPRHYLLMRVAVPPGMTIPALKVPAGNAWRQEVALSRRLGDQWLAGRESVLACVPSVLLPNTWNVLLNPEHSDAKRICISETKRAEFDPRLFGRTRGHPLSG